MGIVNKHLKKIVCWHYPTIFFAPLPLVNFPHNNLNFHWRWRWWNRTLPISISVMGRTLSYKTKIIISYQKEGRPTHTSWSNKLVKIPWQVDKRLVPIPEKLGTFIPPFFLRNHFFFVKMNGCIPSTHCALLTMAKTEIIYPKNEGA